MDFKADTTPVAIQQPQAHSQLKGATPAWASSFVFSSLVKWKAILGCHVPHHCMVLCGDFHTPEFPPSTAPLVLQCSLF